MREELTRADVFAFPSLVEGSAGVTYEALGAGVPVVTTKAAGSVVTHGVDGILVHERDPAALAAALVEVIEDRERRTRMANSARRTAQAYSWDAFADRLVAAMSNHGADAVGDHPTGAFP
jgi:glycosyltransferase involved in cell wall biosynthesis